MNDFLGLATIIVKYKVKRSGNRYFTESLSEPVE